MFDGNIPRSFTVANRYGLNWTLLFNSGLSFLLLSCSGLSYLLLSYRGVWADSSYLTAVWADRSYLTAVWVICCCLTAVWYAHCCLWNIARTCFRCNNYPGEGINIHLHTSKVNIFVKIICQFVSRFTIKSFFTYIYKQFNFYNLYGV